MTFVLSGGITLNIAIVDDLQTDQELLLDFILRYCFYHKISVESERFERGEILLKRLKEKKFDVIFLDIYMDGMDGMETAQKIREENVESLLVFVTNSKQHAVKSYRVRAFDYIVKPFSYDQIEEVLNLCKKSLVNRSRYIEVKEGRTLIKILLREIIYTDYYNHYIQIHTKKRVIKTYMKFPDFFLMMQSYPQFLNCYRNCLVNMDEVSALEERDVLMKNGERVPISRSKRHEIRQQYADYLFHQLETEN